MLVQAPDRTARMDLLVEAGGTVETSFDVTGRDPEVPLQLRLSGLAPTWYTLSAQRLLLRPGEHVPVLLVIHPPAMEHGGAPGVYNIGLDDVEAVPSAWRLRVLPPGSTLERGERAPRSDLLEFLPRHYRADEFLGRFLLIFQAALDPVERAIDNTHVLLDPGLTPPALLEWLATWLDLDLTSVRDVATRRVLVERAVELYRWKGTRRGLRAELTLRLGMPSLIVENFDGLRLGQDAALGVNTHLGRRCDGCVVVTLGHDTRPDPEALDKAEALIEAARPAGSGYVVRLAPDSRPPQPEEADAWRD